MCGLIGYIGKNPIGDEQEVIHRLMRESAIRGTDGWGYAAYFADERTKLYKAARSIRSEDLGKAMEVRSATALIGHTRLATSGTKGTVDCHPLRVRDVIVVHNGMVSNDEAARREFKIPEKSPQVDSYLIAWLIAQESSIASGIESVFKHLRGQLTFLVFSPRSPMTMWAASNVGTIHHFSMKGRDYVASTPEIFKRAMMEEDNWGIYIPGYKVSYPLKGVYELSPFRRFTVVNHKTVEEWQRTSKPGDWKSKASNTVKTRYNPPTVEPPKDSDFIGGECVWRPGLGVTRISKNEAPKAQVLLPSGVGLASSKTNSDEPSRRRLKKRERKRIRRALEYAHTQGRLMNVQHLRSSDSVPPCDTCDESEAAVIYVEPAGVTMLCYPCLRLFVDSNPKYAEVPALTEEEQKRLAHVLVAALPDNTKEEVH